MNSQLARDIFPVLGTSAATRAHKSYVEERLSFLHGQLETAPDQKALYSLQGEIREAKRLLTLRDEIVSAAKED